MSKYKFSEIVINSTAKKKPIDSDKNVYIGLEHLSPDTFLVEKYGSDSAPKGEKLIMKKGDVLFGKRRAYQKKVGIAPCDGIFSAHGMVLRPKEDIVDKDFFPFFIKSDYFLDKAIEISVGSLSPTINWGDLKELEFYLPPLKKQKENAELLWAIENLKVSINQFIYKAKLEMKMIVNKKIKSNNTIKFEDIFNKCKKSTLCASNGNDAGKYPFYTSGSDIKFCDDFLYDNECLIIGNGGTANVNYYKGKFSTANHSFVYTCKSDKYLCKFAYLFLKYNIDLLQNGFQGVGLQNISISYIDGIQMPNVEKEEQEKIIDRISKIENLVDKMYREVINLNLLEKRILDSCFEEE